MKRFLHAGEGYAQNSLANTLKLHITHYIDIPAFYRFGWLAYPSWVPKVTGMQFLVALFKPSPSCNFFFLRTSCIYLGLFFMCLQAAIANQPDPVTDRAGVASSLFQTDSIQPLQVGDTVPLGVWEMPTAILDNNIGLEISDLTMYQDKLIILDYFATWCVPCIQSFPSLNNLQHEFNDEVQIIPITDQSLETIQKALNQLPQLSDNQLPIIVEDDLEVGLGGYFPKRSVPHLVWLMNNKVVAITGHEEIKASTIRRLLDGEPVSFKNKVEDLDFDLAKPFLLYANGGEDSTFTMRSIFSSNKEGLSSISMINTDTLKNQVIITVLNSPLQIGWRFMFPKSGNLPPNRVVYPEGYEHLRDSTFCYQLIAPYSYYNRMPQLVGKDLEAYFGLTANTISKEVDCLLLTRLDTAVHLGVNEKLAIPVLPAYSSQGKNVADFVSWLNRSDPAMIYVINDAKNSSLPPCDFKGGASLLDVNNWLATSNLKLISTRRTLDFLVFTAIN